jgi:aminopeptidase N
MDEGLTTFASARVLAEAYADTHLELRYFGGFVPIAFRDVRLTRETYWNRLPGYRLAAESDEPSGPSFRFSPTTGRYISYNKTALWLNTLERLLGWPTLQRALAAFYERWQFKHPKPDDFFEILQEVAGQDLTWFRDQVHRSSNVFDYGVQTFESENVDGKFRTSAIVRRYGEAVFPVEIEIAFENGEKALERWDGRERWKLLTYVGDRRAVSVHVDPKRVLLLDVNYTNNSQTRSPKGPAAATKWSLKWMVWLQDALSTWAFFV